MLNVLEVLKTLNPNQKINYDKVLKKMIADWKNNTERPNILLHSCCAPCSTFTLEYLSEFADITIYFANSNIYPQSEYKRREAVQRKFVHDFNKENDCNVGFISAVYEPNNFIKVVKNNNLENELEGGKRCESCFYIRLDIVAKKAKDLNFDYFGSALTLSPKKDSHLINEIGIDIQKYFNINYLPSDFKKNNGYKRSIELCKDYGVYRQCYCGCIFAARKQGIDLKKINREANIFLSDQ